VARALSPCRAQGSERAPDAGNPLLDLAFDQVEAARHDFREVIWKRSPLHRKCPPLGIKKPLAARTAFSFLISPWPCSRSSPTAPRRAAAAFSVSVGPV